MKKIIINNLIRYCDDIYPVRRSEILELFNDLNAPYRNEHVDFLEKF